MQAPRCLPTHQNHQDRTRTVQDATDGIVCDMANEPGSQIRATAGKIPVALFLLRFIGWISARGISLRWSLVARQHGLVVLASNRPSAKHRSDRIEQLKC